jgi:hypothetical protein
MAGRFVGTATAPLAGDRAFVECRAAFDPAPAGIAHRRGFYAPFAGRQEVLRRR